MKGYRLGMVLSGVGIALVVVPLIVVTVVFRDQIVFSPSDFINEAFKFMIGVVSMLISFWISQVYWERRTEAAQIARVRNLFHYYLNRIATVIVETSEALARNIQDAEESIQRDQEALANLRRLGDGRGNVLKLLDTSNLELKRDHRMAMASAQFRSVAALVLERLSKQPRIRPQVEAIASDLALVGDEIERIVTYLREERDELDSPGR